MIFHNADSDKSRILSDLKGKAGIYMWTNIESGKIYVGSAFNITERMYNYFSIRHLERHKTSYINNALRLYGYSAFSFSILEIIDITDLSKEEARKLILEREQYYLDFIFSLDDPNTYNILPIAGSRLGARHSVESIIKMSGENNHMFGKLVSEETITKMSEAKGGTNNPMFGRVGDKNPSSKKVYVYDKDNLITLFKEFSSYTEAADFFGCNRRTIYSYIDKNKCYKDQWILYTSLTSKEDS